MWKFWVSKNASPWRRDFCWVNVLLSKSVKQTSQFSHTCKSVLHSTACHNCILQQGWSHRSFSPVSLQGQLFPHLLKSYLLISPLGLFWDHIWLRICSQTAYSLDQGSLMLSWVISKEVNRISCEGELKGEINRVGGAVNHMRLWEGGCYGAPAESTMAVHTLFLVMRIFS